MPPHRIGLISCLDGVNGTALQYLILQLNALQGGFSFEFLPCDQADPFIAALNRSGRVDREDIRYQSLEFWERHKAFQLAYIQTFRTQEQPTGRVVLLTGARFHDNFYSMRQGNVSVIALGNWERWMAPPSILEFALTLTIREAMASVSSKLRGSVHLGTKGCPCDLTVSLDDTRIKVLSSHLCGFCRESLAVDGLDSLIPDIEAMLSKSWLGSADDPASPAGVVSSLGHDLFIVKGLKPTTWENIRTALQKEGVPQFLTLVQTTIGAVLVATFLLILGLK
ncbi:hypothetical protein [Streptomyces sp. GMR22]|uniref:hypothetical protein n=1 Tax=Streptomyces sp. GMR22 TaxID=2759524 RepID=UPI0015FC115E|nr:hypothetical protein [Streptomyces sp. GMR22]MBA6433786.1 hypothetical protein [Streptomyces sp. GMR22]